MELHLHFIMFWFCQIHFAASWSVNNFLMTGPKAFLTYASSVQVGAQNGMRECKHQFAWDRWNCPESALQLSTHNGLRSATRETSFVHAISAAGVMYTLTKNCSMGDFDNCGCDDSKIGQTGGKGWIWGGCSDNAAFGEKISKQFVDALENGHDSRAAINRHNNEAGRLAIKSTMRKACKCHGVSGSCSVKTCWMQLSDFRDVGNFLKAKYEQARTLDMDKTRRMRAGNSADNRNAIAYAFSGVPKTELIYLEESPDYCTRNQSLGYHGTEGRECLRGPAGGGEPAGKSNGSSSQWERQSCRRLCHDCGLRVEEKRIEVVSSCKCKFHWCCTVKCERCTQVVSKYYCSRRERGGPRGGPRRTKPSSRRNRPQNNNNNNNYTQRRHRMRTAHTQ